jgi:hypothetical protein
MPVVFTESKMPYLITSNQNHRWVWSCIDWDKIVEIFSSPIKLRNGLAFPARMWTFPQWILDTTSHATAANMDSICFVDLPDCAHLSLFSQSLPCCLPQLFDNWSLICFFRTYTLLVSIPLRKPLVEVPPSSLVASIMLLDRFWNTSSRVL